MTFYTVTTGDIVAAADPNQFADAFNGGTNTQIWPSNNAGVTPIVAVLNSAPITDSAVIAAVVTGDSTSGRMFFVIRGADGYGALYGGTGTTPTAHMHAMASGWGFEEAPSLLAGGYMTSYITNMADSDDKIGFSLYGITDLGIVSNNHAVVLQHGYGGIWLKTNNYYNGSNDIYVFSSTAAQVSIGPSGMIFRQNSNTPSAGNPISWGNSSYFALANSFSGSGAGTFSHGLGTTPGFVGITVNQTNTTGTVGVNSIGSSTVHVNLFNSGAWVGVAIK